MSITSIEFIPEASKPNERYVQQERTTEPNTSDPKTISRSRNIRWNDRKRLKFIIERGYGFFVKNINLIYIYISYTKKVLVNRII
jgi:hypothetical protein